MRAEMVGLTLDCRREDCVLGDLSGLSLPTLRPALVIWNAWINKLDSN